MKRIKQFNFANYIPEFAHPKLNAVHFAEGKRITTDGRYLIAITTEYPPQMEGVSLCKDFTFNKETYPDWKKVIPDISTGYTSYEIKPDKLRLAYHLKGSFIRIKDSELLLGYIKPYIFDVALEFVCQYFNIKIYVPDNRKSAWMITTNDKDTFFVFMPGYFSEDDDIHADFELNISNGNLTTFGGI